MPNTNWDKLNWLQLGHYAEPFAKIEFASYGYEVFSSEVDDRGVDFVVKDEEGNFLDVQVKATRDHYVFIRKDKIVLDDRHLVCYIRFVPGEMPEIYIIPASVWKTPNEVFVSHDYNRPGQSGKPEWGINYSKRNRAMFAPYEAKNYFEKNQGV